MPYLRVFYGVGLVNPVRMYCRRRIAIRERRTRRRLGGVHAGPHAHGRGRHQSL